MPTAHRRNSRQHSWSCADNARRVGRLAWVYAQLSTSPTRGIHLVLHRGHRATTTYSGDRACRICLAPKRGRGASPKAVPHRCLGGPARPHARHLDPAAGRPGFFQPLGLDQSRLLQKLGATAHISHAPRQRPLATPILGTPDSQCTGLRCPHGLRALQPGQARIRDPGTGLALLQLPPCGARRSLSARLGNHRTAIRRACRFRRIGSDTAPAYVERAVGRALPAVLARDERPAGGARPTRFGVGAVTRGHSNAVRITRSAGARVAGSIFVGASHFSGWPSSDVGSPRHESTRQASSSSSRWS